MKTSNMKKVLSLVIGVALLLTALFVMSSCKKEEEPPVHVHSLVVDILEEPTCTTDGKILTRCTDSECDFSEEAVVPAPGHDDKTIPAKAADCINEGYPKHQVCQTCGRSTLNSNAIVAPLGHTSSEWLDDRDYKNKVNGPDALNEYDILYPTCTEPGYHYTYKECTKCGVNLEYVKVEDAPLGHSICVVEARAASCTIGWDKFEYCDGWSKGELSALGYPNMPAIASSGPKLGSASGNACGYNTYVEHPAIYDHHMSEELRYVEVVAATCEKDGVYALIRECTTCTVTSKIPQWNRPTWDKPDWYTPDVVVYTEFAVTPDGTEKGVIEALGHEWQTHAKQDATCTVDGWETFTMCSRCSKVDTDGDFTNNEEIPVIPAGHIYEPDGCYNICVRDVVNADGSVGKCGHINAADPYHHNVVTLTGKEYDALTGKNEDESMAPTCVDAGYYTCIKYCNDCRRVITREIVRIDPHGHDYVDHIAKEPTCTTVGWNAFKTCTRCNYTDFVQKDALGHTPSTTAEVRVVTSATCLYEGLEKHVYRCTVCNGVDENDENMVKMVKIAKTGCTLVSVAEKPATCTEDGHNAYEYCTVCGASTMEVYGKLGHIIENKDAKAATCTEDGWYAYSVCTRDNCGYNNKSEMMINALGHDMVYVAVQNPTCTEVGYTEHYDCSRCDLTEGKKEIAATGHNGLDPVVEAGTSATCVAGGNYYEVVYCGNANCGIELERKSVATSAIGHNFSNSTGYCQNNCGDRISIGLAYSNNPDGLTCVVSGIGNCTDTEIIIPDVINGRKVVGIAYEAFYRNKNITKVVIGNNVETIEAFAFSSCSNLTQVVIGSGVKLIENSAFRDCSKLSSVGYVGTAAQWNGITIKTVGNDYLKNATRYYI